MIALIIDFTHNHGINEKELQYWLDVNIESAMMFITNIKDYKINSGTLPY